MGEKSLISSFRFVPLHVMPLIMSRFLSVENHSGFSHNERRPERENRKENQLASLSSIHPSVHPSIHVQHPGSQILIILISVSTESIHSFMHSFRAFFRSIQNFPSGPIQNDQSLYKSWPCFEKKCFPFRERRGSSRRGKFGGLMNVHLNSVQTYLLSI